MDNRNERTKPTPEFPYISRLPPFAPDTGKVIENAPIERQAKLSWSR